MQTKDEKEQYRINIEKAINLSKQIQPLLCERKRDIALQHCFELTDLLTDPGMNLFYPGKARKLLLDAVSWFEAFLSNKDLDVDNQNKCCEALARIYYFWASWKGFGYAPPNLVENYQKAIKYTEQLDPKKTEDYLQLGLMYNALSSVIKEAGDVATASQLATKANSYLAKEKTSYANSKLLVFSTETSKITPVSKSTSPEP